jgi:hypothetical protein
MKRGNKKRINYLIILLNRMFRKHLKHLQMFHYPIENAYIEVFKEMCKLLNADIIYEKYRDWLRNRPKPERFRQYHYYINMMWKIVKSTKKNDELCNLTITLSHLLIEEYEFVIDALK